MKLIDRTGQRYGRLTVLHRTEPLTGPDVFWLCRCDCGNERQIPSRNLRSGNSKSCGCYGRDQTRKANTVHGLANRCREYACWVAIRQRCENQTHKYYRYYGGRGITVCDRWQIFTHFLSDMGPRPSPKHSIDRIDNDGPYSPENCRWATTTEQAMNRSNNVRLTFRGKTQTVTEWAHEVELPYPSVWARLQFGWTIERALTTPIRPNGRKRRP